MKKIHLSLVGAKAQFCSLKTAFILLLVCCFVNLLPAQAKPFTHLVFEGAGIRGIAYSGVIRVLEKQHLLDQVQKVGGTSAGAITALMVSLGYTSEEIYAIISTTKFQKFNDGQYMFIGGIARMQEYYGWYRGKEFTEWIEAIIERKTKNKDISFKELKAQGFKSLYVTATCINRQKLMVLSADTYPEMKVKDAIRISMSIPLYFEAVFVDSVGRVYENPKSGQALDIMVDGGILGNFPIFMFDSIYVDSIGREQRIPNPTTLGVRIESDDQIRQDSVKKELVPMEISNLSDYVYAFYVLVLENLNRIPLLPADWERTISVSSVGIGPRIKRLSEEQKQALIQSGEQAARGFLGQD